MLSMRACDPRYSILNLNILASFRCKHHQPTEFVLTQEVLACCEDVYCITSWRRPRLYDVVSVLLKDPQTGFTLKDMLAG